MFTLSVATKNYDGKSRKLDTTSFKDLHYGGYSSYIAEHAKFKKGDKVYYEVTIKGGEGAGNAPQIGWVSTPGIRYCGHGGYKGYGIGDTPLVGELMEYANGYGVWIWTTMTNHPQKLNGMNLM